jgi:hypothetical protein
MSDTDKKLDEIRARHERDERWHCAPSVIRLQSHEDRGFLLTKIERLRAQIETLAGTIAQIERAAAGAIYSQEMIHAMARDALKSLEAKP